jgi:hypothetical protein
MQVRPDRGEADAPRGAGGHVHALAVDDAHGERALRADLDLRRELALLVDARGHLAADLALAQELNRHSVARGRGVDRAGHADLRLRDDVDALALVQADDVESELRWRLGLGGRGQEQRCGESQKSEAAQARGPFKG